MFSTNKEIGFTFNFSLINTKLPKCLEDEDFRISKVKPIFIIADIIKRVCNKIILPFHTCKFEGCMMIIIIIFH